MVRHTAATDCDYIPRQSVPTARGVSRASRGAGRAAVADAGRLTPVLRRRPKPHGSGAPFRAPLGFHWRGAGRGQSAGRAPFGAHQRWIATVSPPGGMRSKPRNTARGTPGTPAKPAATIACVPYPHRTQGCGVCGPGVPRALALRGETLRKPRARRAARMFLLGWSRCTRGDKKPSPLTPTPNPTPQGGGEQ